LEKEGDESLVNMAGEKWPYAGGIEFDNVTMRYRRTLDPCINQLSFKAEPTQKIGIIGRTGAGKSSTI